MAKPINKNQFEMFTPLLGGKEVERKDWHENIKGERRFWGAPDERGDVNPLAAHLERPMYPRKENPERFTPRYTTSSSIERVPVEKLESVQSDIDPKHVKKLAKVPGDKLPPVEVSIDEKGRHWVVDGNHRANAALFRGDETVRAEVRRHPETPQGTRNYERTNERDWDYDKRRPRA